MINLIFQTGIATALSWILFIVVDMFWKLPFAGGVCGADAIAREVQKAGGDLKGGTMMGNIVSSPDASAGTLFAACGVYAAGIPGGILATLLVYIGNRICHDPGYAGTSGCVLGTIMVYFTGIFLNIPPECFIAGMVIAILTIQGSSHKYASILLARLWRLRP